MWTLSVFSFLFAYVKQWWKHFHWKSLTLIRFNWKYIIGKLKLRRRLRKTKWISSCAERIRQVEADFYDWPTQNGLVVSERGKKESNEWIKTQFSCWRMGKWNKKTRFISAKEEYLLRNPFTNKIDTIRVKTIFRRSKLTSFRW